MLEINPKDISLEERWIERKKFKPFLKPPFPTKEMLVELVNACNHRCIFCGHQKMKRPRKEIDSNLLQRVLHEAYDLGTREVGFYSTGEPFICSKLSDYVKMAKTIGFNYVYITTNGVLASPDRIKAVVDNGVDSIKFSINAGSRESYKLVHGFDDFEKAISNLIFCYNYRKSTGKDFRIYISYVVTKYNDMEKEFFKEKYSKYCDQISFYPVMNFGGLMSEIYTHITPTDYVKEIKKPCHLLFTAIGITCEGYLTACGCADFQNYLIVADLNHVSLSEGWYSEKFEELRKRYIEDKLEGLQCFNCVYGKEKPFIPLMEEYASIIEMKEIYTDQYINERLSANRWENK